VKISQVRTTDSKERFFGTAEKLIYGIVVLVSALFIAASVIVDLLFTQISIRVAAGFFKELGFAGLIAVIIIITVEHFNRRRQRFEMENLSSAILKDVYKAVYQKYIPPPVFEQVDNCLMKANVYRDNYKVTYTLHDMPKQEDTDSGPKDGTNGSHLGHLLCEVHTSYRLQNLAPRQIVHPIQIDLERPIEDALAPFCRILSIKIDDRSLSAKEITDHTTDDGSQIKFKYECEIPRDRSIFVRTRAELVKRDTDVEIYGSYLPSDGIDLTVDTAGKNIDVRAHAFHPESLECCDPPSRYTKAWRLTSGIFPYQALVFWWKRS
jgi:hypothetical protein